jgi:hypothetical protein
MAGIRSHIGAGVAKQAASAMFFAHLAITRNQKLVFTYLEGVEDIAPLRFEQ